ncbi:SurA N-terminal domain-containing protein [Undibacterium sp. TS12]|uniref:SurA N-terminal domain-containing protein n=1 Tax=Undibacterium sp. TS12 TaxID=2908202 RepID=UPI001F4C659E|nr:SurA N-terminal domain-containing protein [Undibacterium sp. TS12]MCH8618955.1 SurA N-terminal domain-containing protein [Undibacterium sp. TS12]
MFEFIRTHQRLMQILLAVLILPSFVLFGNTDALRNIGKEAGIATVNGAPISQAEFDLALRDQLDRMRQAYGPQFDAKMLNTPEERQNILDGLIARKTMAVDIERKKLLISDATIRDYISSLPGLVKADGHFDNEQYTRLLSMQGMTPAMFEQRQRQDMVLQQLLGPVRDGAFVPKTVADRFSAINEQEREVQMLMLKSDDFASRVKVTDEMLKAYYEKNAAQFEIPEQINAEYVVFSADTLAAQQTASDAEVQDFYKNNQKLYTIKEEQRRASHILIAVAKGSSAADKAKAKAKAEGILAQARKNPEDFGKLAAANSDDPGSKEKNGDLDFFDRERMVPEFSKVAFSLKQGDISDLVETEFGFHIITVTGIKPGSVKPLDEVKTQVAEEIKKQKAAKVYADSLEAFTNMLEDQGDSLKPVADKFKLKIETATGLTRLGKPVAAANGVDNPKFLKAIFADGVVKKKHNTEAVEVAPKVMLAGHVVEYKAASRRPFDEVKAAIQAQVTLTEAAALAEKEGIAKLAALKAADSTAGFTEAKMVSRLKNQDIPTAALVDLMRADVQKLPAFVGTSLGKGGYVIFRVGKVVAGTPDKERRASEAQQLANMQSSQNLYAYLELLKQRSKVTVNKAAVTAPVTATP